MRASGTNERSSYDDGVILTMAKALKQKPKRKSTGRISNGVLGARLDSISSWMSQHGVDDSRRFDRMDTSMKSLASKDDVIEAVQVLAKAFETHAAADKEWKDDFRKSMEPVLRIYQGSIFTKSFILGAAAVIGGVVGIGYGLMTIAQWLSTPK